MRWVRLRPWLCGLAAVLALCAFAHPAVAKTRSRRARAKESAASAADGEAPADAKKKRSRKRKGKATAEEPIAMDPDAVMGGDPPAAAAPAEKPSPRRRRGKTRGKAAAEAPVEATSAALTSDDEEPAPKGKRRRRKRRSGKVRAPVVVAAPPLAAPKPAPAPTKPTPPPPPKPTVAAAPPKPPNDEGKLDEIPDLNAPTGDGPAHIVTRATETPPPAPAAEPAPAPEAVLPGFELAVGAGAVGRSFGWDAPLQTEATLARTGLFVDVDVRPLRAASSAVRGLGLRVSWAREFGYAVVPDGPSRELPQPVRSERWSFLGTWAWSMGRISPIALLGIHRHHFEIPGGLRALPSECPNTSTLICVPSIDQTSALAGLELRWRIGRHGALYMNGRGIYGLEQEGGPGSIRSEARPLSFGGAGELGALIPLASSFGLRPALFVEHHEHQFGASKDLAYTRAYETYFGARLGVLLTLSP